MSTTPPPTNFFRSAQISPSDQALQGLVQRSTGCPDAIYVPSSNETEQLLTSFDGSHADVYGAGKEPKRPSPRRSPRQTRRSRGGVLEPLDQGRTSRGRMSRTEKKWTGWRAADVLQQELPRDTARTAHGNRQQICGEQYHCARPVDNPTREQTQAVQLPKLTYWIRNDTTEPYWTHELYSTTAGSAVRVLYPRNFAAAESAAAALLNEPVLGFDMEWKPFRAKGIKGNISLIQVAAEDRIVLFHIALFAGRTVAQLLPPSLRKIIETDTITKCGVAINNADGNRLRRFMKLEPKGMFELSHLHNVIAAATKRQSTPEKRLIKLMSLVKIYLGGNLFKGKVRTSDWTKPLDEDQVRYAAADAYAGFRLFHAMETKRLKLTPVPPRPCFAELGLPLMGLDMGVEDAQSAPTAAVSPEEPIAGLAPQPRPSKDRQLGSAPKASDAMQKYQANIFSPVSTRRAYSALNALRIRLATKANVPAEHVISNIGLEELIAIRPTSREVLDLLVSCQTFCALADEHDIDLLGFLGRHCFPKELKDPA